MKIAKLAVRVGIIGAGVYVAIRLVQRYQLVDKAVVLADELLTRVYNLTEGHLATEDGSDDDLVIDERSKDFDSPVPASGMSGQGSS